MIETLGITIDKRSKERPHKMKVNYRKNSVCLFKFLKKRIFERFVV
jgi:hypothetical protein